MRLSRGHTRMIMDNINLLRFCQVAEIDLSIFYQCDIEKMDNQFMFVLQKENAPQMPEGVYGCDLRAQPDIVLIVEPDENGNLIIGTTRHTVRILKSMSDSN